MKLLKRLGLILLFVIAVGAIGIMVFLRNQKPNYNEHLDIKGLSDHTNVYYDDYGVPHIYADNYKDAYTALGYVHAKDRLWQMELLRRIAPGRLSEMFGPSSLETDKFFRSLDLSPLSVSAVERFRQECPQEIKNKVDAYIIGVNQFINNGPTPIEYRILGIEKTAYELEDMYNVMAYMSFSFAMAHKTEPMLTDILQDHGREYVEDLNTHIDTSTTLIESTELKDITDLSTGIHELLEGMPVPQLIGSNSWVIGPSKTEEGGVVFANDPHIGYAQPSVWYEAHMEVGDASIYGNYVAGFPMPLIGNTRHHAIGLTMFENDDIDFYEERINPEDPSQYWHKDEWKSIQNSVETIEVKGGDNYEIKLERTVHGPIVSKYTKGMSTESSIAMYWVYEHFPLHIVEACHQIMFATSIEGVQEGVEMIAAPGLNIMYGDVEGNIAWWAAGKLPKRPENVNPKFILDGSTGENDITAYYDFSENPQAINPEEGYVYSANNQSTSPSGIGHWGYYLPEDRARRIRYLLEAKDDWNTEAVKEMIIDVTSLNTPEIANQLISYLETQDLNQRKGELISILEDWDGSHELDDIAPVIYYKWLYLTLESIMSDEVEEGLEAFLNTHVMKRSIQPLIFNSNSVWWDKIQTTDKETPSQIVNEALEATIRELEEQLGADESTWKWSRVHSVEHPHALGANETLRPYFSVGPYPVMGSREVINNFSFLLSPDGTYEANSGPSCRRVISLQDLDQDNWSVLPTGQSGNRWSAHYKDQAEMYVNGEFRRQLMNKEEIIEQAKHHTILNPN